MIDIRIDTTALDAFRRGWDAKAQKALVSAFKGEAFRLKTVVQQRLSRGEGPPTAPLTRAEEKTPTSQALSALSRFVAYEVRTRGRDVSAEIGFSRSVTRARSPGGKKKQLVALFGGGRHPINRADQERIARKVRKRLGEPVGRRRRASRSRNVGRKWADIRILIPKLGTVVTWPERDWVTGVVRSERSNSATNIAKLYETALRGERWATGRGKQWWTETAGEVRLRGGGVV